MLDCLRLGRRTAAPEGEKRERKRDEREKEVGLQTELDMIASSVFCLWAVLLPGVDRGPKRGG